MMLEALQKRVLQGLRFGRLSRLERWTVKLAVVAAAVSTALCLVAAAVHLDWRLAVATAALDVMYAIFIIIFVCIRHIHRWLEERYTRHMKVG